MIRTWKSLDVSARAHIEDNAQMSPCHDFGPNLWNFMKTPNLANQLLANAKPFGYLLPPAADTKDSCVTPRLPDCFWHCLFNTMLGGERSEDLLPQVCQCHNDAQNHRMQLLSLMRQPCVQMIRKECKGELKVKTYDRLRDTVGPAVGNTRLRCRTCSRGRICSTGRTSWSTQASRR